MVPESWPPRFQYLDAPQKRDRIRFETALQSSCDGPEATGVVSFGSSHECWARLTGVAMVRDVATISVRSSDALVKVYVTDTSTAPGKPAEMIASCHVAQALVDNMV